MALVSVSGDLFIGNSAGHIKAVLLPESERLDGAQARRNGVQLDNAIFMCPTPFLTGSISDFSVADPRTIRECSLWKTYKQKESTGMA